MKVCARCAEPYAGDGGFCPLDGTPLTRDPDPFVGRTLAARYRLVRKIGSGGMALVYLARHVMIERLSAIDPGNTRISKRSSPSVAASATRPRRGSPVTSGRMYA